MTPAEQIARLADMPLDLEVELDHKTLALRDVLALETGSVIKLNNSAGENINILAGGRLLGFGEIVIIEDSMGVRITDFNSEE